MLVEGCGQTNLGKNWGDGLAVDRAIVTSRRIDSAENLFATILGKPYVNNVVAAPHVYPPSISRSTSENSVSLLLFQTGCNTLLFELTPCCLD